MSDENGSLSPEELVRMKTKQQFHQVGLWQAANTIRQHLGLSRAAIESKYSDKVKDFSFLDELPLGTTTNVTINEDTTPKKASPLKTAALAVALAAASGGVGFLANDYFQPEPVPIEAILEWEVPIVREEVKGSVGESNEIIRGAQQGTSGDVNGKPKEGA